MNRSAFPAGLTETLRGTGPYTVFATSADAFKAVPAKTLAELASNKHLLECYVSEEDAMASQVDVPVGNGVVHVIDRVLMPPKT